MHRIATALVVVILMVTPAAGQGYEKSVEAFKRGDYATAMRYWRSIAKRGNVQAQILVGTMYDKGQGVLRDYYEAAKWYRLAANQGHAGVQSLLGFLYFKGRGVPHDYVQAHMWLDLAASQGDQASASFRDSISRNMTVADAARAQHMAREWMEKYGE